MEAVLGGNASLFAVVEVDHWVFKFCVASSRVGFMIYALRSFACLDFKMLFFLWNEAGLSLAKASVVADHTPPWDGIPPSLDWDGNMLSLDWPSERLLIQDSRLVFIPLEQRRTRAHQCVRILRSAVMPLIAAPLLRRIRI